ISFVTLAKGSGTLNLLSGTLNVTNGGGQLDLGHGAIGGDTSTLNVSGVTLNVSRIQYSTGNASSANNTTILSAGPVSLGPTVYGRNGTTPINSFIMSGGTVSCLPGANAALSGLIPTILTNSPGPGVVTFAPPAGQSISLAPGVSGPGTMNV